MGPIHSSYCTSVSVPLPSHDLPPCEGDGLSQLRVRERAPPPQEREQPLHSLHLLQDPSTAQGETQFPGLLAADDSPGQTDTLHTRLSTTGPGQGRPPYSGAGWSQLRLRVWMA